MEKAYSLRFDTASDDATVEGWHCAGGVDDPFCCESSAGWSWSAVQNSSMMGRVTEDRALCAKIGDDGLLSCFWHGCSNSYTGNDEEAGNESSEGDHIDDVGRPVFVESNNCKCCSGVLHSNNHSFITS
jgi:hypothetical protein